MPNLMFRKYTVIYRRKRKRNGWLKGLDTNLPTQEFTCMAVSKADALSNFDGWKKEDPQNRSDYTYIEVKWETLR